jgi:signal transduction histidine kinase
MNPFLSLIQEQIKNSQLGDGEKHALLKTLSDADKQWAITDFKLDRTEKVKKTTAILLEETIEELEKKRKAVELQNRELEIEAALDHARTQSMVMQHSSELDEALLVFHQQVLLLGIPSEFSFLWLPDEEKDRHIFWAAWAEGSGDVIKTKAINYPLDRNDPATQQCLIDWKTEESVYSYHVPPSGVQNYFAVWSELLAGVEKLKPEYFTGGLYYVEAFMKYGCFGVMVVKDLSEDEKKILARFAIEFERTYTRFLDLQLAEAQAEQAKLNLLQIKEEKLKAETALLELKAAQTQLIQAEKMASLGELTAGIAHEIQNPLNFVNNFSEVSSELLDEMNEELEKGDLEEAKAIASDIKQNLEKIGHHGKRADAIVKGMLQHTRSSAGEKQLTDINKLADEFLRLAYHGIRAKDNGFNVALRTAFDESIGLVNTVSQDMGRVLLNLINNAFYAVDEKNKTQHHGEYHPTVSVSTRKINNRVEVEVSDNGNGIPQKILDKVFQPFFTTKPTGQGTGLGLSLCYDIVKSNGGEIKVSTTEGEGARFVVSIPAGSDL